MSGQQPDAGHIVNQPQKRPAPVRICRSATLLIAFLMANFCAAPSLRAGPEPFAPAAPWSSADLLAPAALAKELAAPAAGERPVLLCVGFQPLYHGAHIPGATLAGPASRPEGIAALRKAVRDLPADRPLVIYCGCCPFKDCPNVRPAFNTLREMGFQRIRVVLMPHDFAQDWTLQGFPVEKGDRGH